jgi:cysteine desulfurase
MGKIYLDSAATSQINDEVINEMMRVLKENYGNASSSHSFGRTAKTEIETSRKTIAKLLNCNAQEIIFTANATEGTNLILRSAVKDLGIKRIITTKIEHHATLKTVSWLKEEYNVQVDFVKILPNGTIDYNHFEELIQIEIPTLVTLIHVNNETGTILDIEKIGNLCKQNNALFHCDTVQSIGKTEFNLTELPVDFIVASAHKFHGPKGVGFAFIRKNRVLKPIVFGGEQEKGLRAGTEAIHQIVGLAKAMELCYQNLNEERVYITDLKNYCLEQIKVTFPEAKENSENSFYNILNVCFPFSEEKTAMILFNLDIKGIAVSRGSACQSGSIKPSHVLAEFLSEEDLKKPSLRISFSHYNTKHDIDGLIDALKSV